MPVGDIYHDRRHPHRPQPGGLIARAAPPSRLDGRSASARCDAAGNRRWRAIARCAQADFHGQSDACSPIISCMNLALIPVKVHSNIFLDCYERLSDNTFALNDIFGPVVEVLSSPGRPLMTMSSKWFGLLGLALALGLAVAPAQAQATRTWVSGVGHDGNPASRTAPCKTFAGAISKTAT